ncbi:hypothetical protein K501DRAFT_286853 [Backusella circina FSU 941]|nr:hypothetical protein K501DRAFT_286853 [Backusella circina FSU 941]
MQLNVIAPCPKKPSGMAQLFESKEDDACLELRQILHSPSYHCILNSPDEHIITRTGNPLVQDSSFIPLHQAVSQLHVNDATLRRPRSYSVGDYRNHHLVQPIPCKPIY